MHASKSVCFISQSRRAARLPPAAAVAGLLSRARWPARACQQLLVTRPACPLCCAVRCSAVCINGCARHSPHTSPTPPHLAMPQVCRAGGRAAPGARRAAPQHGGGRGRGRGGVRPQQPQHRQGDAGGCAAGRHIWLRGPERLPWLCLPRGALSRAFAAWVWFRRQSRTASCRPPTFPPCDRLHRPCRSQPRWVAPFLPSFRTPLLAWGMRPPSSCEPWQREALRRRSRCGRLL